MPRLAARVNAASALFAGSNGSKPKVSLRSRVGIRFKVYTQTGNTGRVMSEILREESSSSHLRICNATSPKDV